MCKCLRKKLLDFTEIWCQSHPRAFALRACWVVCKLNPPRCVTTVWPWQLNYESNLRKRWNQKKSRPFWLSRWWLSDWNRKTVETVAIVIFQTSDLPGERNAHLMFHWSTFDEKNTASFWSLHPSCFLCILKLSEFEVHNLSYPKQDQGAPEVFIVTVNHCLWRSARWIKLSSKGTRRYGAQHSTWHGCDDHRVIGSLSHSHRQRRTWMLQLFLFKKKLVIELIPCGSYCWLLPTKVAQFFVEWLFALFKAGTECGRQNWHNSPCLVSRKLAHEFHRVSSCFSSHRTCQIWQKWPHFSSSHLLVSPCIDGNAAQFLSPVFSEARQRPHKRSDTSILPGFVMHAHLKHDLKISLKRIMLSPRCFKNRPFWRKTSLFPWKPSSFIGNLEARHEWWEG